MTALYIRDHAALDPQSTPHLPALDPSVSASQETVTVSRDLLSTQLSRWWDFLTTSTVPLFDASNPIQRRKALSEALDRDGDAFPELQESPEPQSLARYLLPDATYWIGLHGPTRPIDSHKMAITLGNDFLAEEHKTVKRVLRRHLTRPKPFSYTILEIPLASSGAWPLARSAAIVSSALRADPAQPRSTV